MKVNLFDLKFEPEYIQKFTDGCREILEGGFISEAKYTKEFERKFSEFQGCKHSICVTSGTAALEVALRAVGVEDKEVIIPSNTFFATSVAVKNANGILGLCDIEDETFSICPKDLRTSIVPGLTKAVIIVHIGGIISKHIEEIVAICKEHDVVLIEDAAHAVGASHGEYKAGSIGDIGCFSFFPTKVMTTGEGGMITTNNDCWNEKCRSLRNFGRDPKDIGLCIYDFGDNFKVSEFTSLMGCLEMDRVASRIERRRHLAKIYKDRLGDIFDVFYDDSIVNSFYKCIVKTPETQEFYKGFCKERGVSLTGEVYKIPVHEQPLYKDEFCAGRFPVTNHFSKHHICPPLYPELTDEQVEYTCQVLRECHENKSS